MGIAETGQLQQKQRNYLYDNIKAILIFSVVLAHFFKVNGDFRVDSPAGVIYVTAFCYIMQGFLFISGFFSKNVDKCRKRAFEMFLFPYIILMPIMYLIRYLLNGYATVNFFVPTMALWYLVVMFYYRFFIKTLSRIPYILPVSVLVSLAAGCICVFGSTAALGRAFGFLPFFILGYCMKQEYLDWILKIPKAVFIVLMICLLGVSVGIAYGSWIPVNMLYLKNCYEMCGMGMLEGIAARAAIFIISLLWVFVLFGLTPKNKNFLSVIGANTMSVYVLHIVIRYVIERFGLPGAGTPAIYVLTIAAAAAVTWILSRPAISDAYNKGMSKLYGWFCKIISPVTKRIHL